jgi:hypothetical protein
MADYRYLAFDARTNQFLAELPLQDVSWSEELNAEGDLNAVLDLRVLTTNGTSLAGELMTASTPRRTKLFVERDGQLVWPGMIWTRARQKGSQGRISISALGLWSYLARRRLTVTKSYTAADQLAIVQDLITWAQAQPAGDIGIEVGTETSGVLVTRKPLAWGYEYRKIGDLVDELRAGDNGFDFSISASYDTFGQPECRLLLHYPRRGRKAGESNIVFFNAAATGGNLIDWDLDESGLDAATTTYGIGSGEGDSMIQTVASDTSYLDAGYPLTETVITHKAITSPEQLLAINLQHVRDNSADVRTWGIDVDPDDTSTPFGTWTVGDDVRLVLDDEYMFPANGSDPGLETVLRITGQTVNVSNDGGPDSVSLTLGVLRA